MYISPNKDCMQKDFDGAKYISLLIKNYELLDKAMKFCKKLKIISEKNSIVNQDTIKNI